MSTLMASIPAINDNDMESQHLKIQSLSSEIIKVERLVDEVCQELHVNENHYANILVSITEAVNNAIIHGNKADSGKWVNVTFNHVDNKSIEFVIEDQGPGFDYSTLPDPTLPENIEKESGRGIFLMKHLADKVSFDNNGKIVRLTFNISGN